MSDAPTPDPPSPSDRAEVLQRAVHDLKNPIAVVRASLEWLEVELAGREDALDAVRDGTLACVRLIRIVDDLEVLSRLHGDRPMERGSIAVDAMLAAAAASAERRISRPLTIETRSPPLAITGDVALLDRAVEALVEACARGARSGSVIELSAQQVDAVVEIVVAVRGAIDAIATETSLPALDSTGLGIYLALRVARAHGGTLGVVATDSAPRLVLRVPV